MEKPNKNIKKLSTAITRGLKIAKERGIKKVRHRLIKTNSKGEVCGACALGMGLIGLVGVERAKELDKGSSDKGYKTLNEAFPSMRNDNKCVISKSPKKFKKEFMETDYDWEKGTYKKKLVDAVEVETFVMTVNDSTNAPIEEIVEVLKECKL